MPSFLSLCRGSVSRGCVLSPNAIGCSGNRLARDRAVGISGREVVRDEKGGFGGLGGRGNQDGDLVHRMDDGLFMRFFGAWGWMGPAALVLAGRLLARFVPGWSQRVSYETFFFFFLRPTATLFRAD